MTSTASRPGARRRSADEHQFDITIGHRIRAARGLRRLSQGDLAERLGVTFQQVQKYEDGSNRLPTVRLVAVAAATNLPLTFFFDDIALPSGDPGLPQILALAARIARLPPLIRDGVGALLDTLPPLLTVAPRQAAE